MNIFCFSHLRWDFVYQRPQNLFTRFSKQHKIYFVEEPIFSEDGDHNIIASVVNNIHIVTPTAAAVSNYSPIIDSLKKSFLLNI
jgi:UDP-galactopyranose mutase